MADSARDLPLDLIEEVLIRLPAESIGRSRCVSKPWRSLLSSPKFIKSHFNLHIHGGGATNILVGVNSEHHRHFFTFTTDGGDARAVTSPLLNVPNWFILNVCHGFALLALESRNRMLVINPLTLEGLEVVDSTPHSDSMVYHYRLGYDSLGDDFKIVRLSYSSACIKESAVTFVDVYSLKMKSWMRLNSLYGHVFLYFSSGAFVNGCFHWVAFDVKEGSYVIIAFDLAREEFHEVPSFKNLNCLCEAVVLGGCLAVICRISCFFEVWVMEEYGVQNSWRRVTANPGQIREVVCLSREGDIVFANMSKQLVAYNPATSIWRIINVNGIPEYLLADALAWTFTKCLLSPNHISD